MTSSKRLEPIKKLANNQEQKAAKALGTAIELKKNEERKLNQLLQYQKEYLTGMESKVKLGVSGAMLQSYHQFLNKIEVAISQQKNVLIECEERITTSQGRWKNDHSRNNAIGQAISKIKVKEQKLENKEERAQADELSTIAFIQRQRMNEKT